MNVSKLNRVKHFIFASTSSVYGNPNKFPVNENFLTDKPLSFYAATKKATRLWHIHILTCLNFLQLH